MPPLVSTLRSSLLAPINEMMQPPPGLEHDFAQPRGEPALVPPNSVSWRIFKNPLSLFIGGVAAVILELAEPSVRSGVWDHSSFRKDAITRLRRTGAAAMMTIYGPRSAAEDMIAHVVAMHDRVRGTTPAGDEYRANDQRLLDWVQATASFGFMEAYSRYVSPLAREERSRAFAEGEPAAKLYGALGAPLSLEEWEALLARTAVSLEHSAVLEEFLSIMRDLPVMGVAGVPMQRLLVRAAVDLVPCDIRTQIGLEGRGLSPWQLPIVRSIGKLVDRVPLDDAPPARASVRVGLPPDWLYRR